MNGNVGQHLVFSGSELMFVTPALVTSLLNSNLFATPLVSTLKPLPILELTRFAVNYDGSEASQKLKMSTVKSGSVSLCDGTELLQRTREQCGAGVNFGNKKPDCICVSGIYRFVADSCETADGFAESVCTKISDDNGSGASIVGVKFTRDPINWQQTGIVCERRGFGTETWDFITDKHSRGSASKSTNIYTLNGKAFMTKGSHDKQVFCVEPSRGPDNEKVCRYLQSENSDFWQVGEIDVIVKSSCDGGSPLSPHKCFGVLTSKDSECQLTCSSNTPKPKPMGRSMGGGPRGRSMGGEPKGAPPAPKPVSAMSMDPSQSLVNATHPTEYWKHDNKYLNRKMMIYNIINQLGSQDSNSSNSTNGTSNFGEPKRTFELFDMMKNIATSYCPDEYVNKDWVDLVIDLFYILHKGNIFKYDENLSEGDYKWIKDILTKCHERISAPAEKPENGPEKPNDNVIILSPTPTDDEPNDEICHNTGGGRATGYCNGTTLDGECSFKPMAVKSNRANDSLHYVPDVAWDIVDIIQVICFKEFNESYRMFHVLEQAAEKLFTLQIKNLWYFPNWSIKTKKRLLGTSADTQMWNLEICIESAYDKNGQIPRLVRPPPVKYLRKKRAAPKEKSSQGQFVDVYCSRTRKEFIAPTNCPQQE